MLSQTALKFDAQVQKNGQIELHVPFAPGEHVTVFVIQSGDTFFDLMNAAQTSQDFWDNPFDDEDWNNA